MACPKVTTTAQNLLKSYAYAQRSNSHSLCDRPQRDVSTHRALAPEVLVGQRLELARESVREQFERAVRVPPHRGRVLALERPILRHQPFQGGDV